MKLGQTIRMLRDSRFYKKGQQAAISELWNNNDALVRIPNTKGNGFRIIHIRLEAEGILWERVS